VHASFLSAKKKLTADQVVKNYREVALLLASGFTATIAGRLVSRSTRSAS
jgi:hypothetical protein